ncbi:hypothetical protein L9F63_022167, partial [Diploptera punctata]
NTNKQSFPLKIPLHRKAATPSGPTLPLRSSPSAVIKDSFCADSAVEVITPPLILSHPGLGPAMAELTYIYIYIYIYISNFHTHIISRHACFPFSCVFFRVVIKPTRLISAQSENVANGNAREAAHLVHHRLSPGGCAFLRVLRSLREIGSFAH